MIWLEGSGCGPLAVRGHEDKRETCRFVLSESDKFSQKNILAYKMLTICKFLYVNQYHYCRPSGKMATAVYLSVETATDKNFGGTSRDSCLMDSRTLCLSQETRIMFSALRML